MIAAFGIHFFYPDGEPPESGVQRFDTLSEKWLSICRDVFKLNGPVFTHNMGNSLSHFDIEFAGPICKLKINGRTCFELAITSGVAAQQDIATIDYFRTTLGRYVCLSGSELSDSASAKIKSAVANPSVLVIDHLVNDIEDEQKHALIELGYHFVGAYYEYLTHNDGRTYKGLDSASLF